VKDKMVLTYSNIRLADCPRKFKLRVIDGLVPIVKKRALALGYLVHYGRDKGLAAALDQIDYASAISSDEVDKMHIDEAILTGILSNADEVFKDNGNVEREPEWLLPVRNPDTLRHSRLFNIGGKADGIYEGNNVGGNWWTVIEEKTTARSPGESDILKLDLDQQVMNEVACLQRARGILVDYVKYRYLLKPFIKQRKDESVEQYCTRIKQDYKDRPEFYFREEKLLIDQKQVREWERDLWHITQVLNFCYRNNHWYKNTSRCAEWGGCIYLPLCRGEDAERLYKKEPVNQELQEVAQVGFDKTGDSQSIARG